ncbi:hypothetical protein D3C86_948770 [compost metagenome]
MCPIFQKKRRRNDFYIFLKCKFESHKPIIAVLFLPHNFDTNGLSRFYFANRKTQESITLRIICPIKFCLLKRQCRSIFRFENPIRFFVFWHSCKSQKLFAINVQIKISVTTARSSRMSCYPSEINILPFSTFWYGSCFPFNRLISIRISGQKGNRGIILKSRIITNIFTADFFGKTIYPIDFSKKWNFILGKCILYQKNQKYEETFF